MAKVTRQQGTAPDVAKALKQLDGLEAQTGWFASSKYPDGTPVAYVATIQEFGSPEQGIDSRSFQRVTLANKRDAYSELMAKGAKGVFDGKIGARAMLNAFGLQVAGDIRATIAAGDFKALADSTLEARARRRRVNVAEVNSDPLRDTNVMVNTLTNAVGGKDSL